MAEATLSQERQQLAQLEVSSQQPHGRGCA